MTTDKNNNNGNYNSGDSNSGYYNSGNYNSGYYNSGNYNSGNSNSGNYNSGDSNSGNYNSGDSNSGNSNSGDSNSGNSNSGNSNSGHYNSGNSNSGNYNSGNSNSGHYNSGHYNSGHFNTNSPKIRLFNKDTNLDKVSIPYIDLQINEWISENKMTDAQKLADKNFFVKKGTLITRTYKEAFVLAWGKLEEKVKQQFKDLPNFDADIFFEITGVDVRIKEKEVTCSGKIVEIDGKKYKLTEV